MEYKVKIDAFEGPLDLLLHLIRQLEIDIYDIPVATITEQYLEFVRQMHELRLDVASEYLVMAATLIEMKSRMLLPKPKSADEAAGWDEDTWEEDPREQLMARLIEYKKFKDAASTLKQREQAQRLVFTKKPSDLSAFESADSAKRETGSQVSLFDMIEALQLMMERKKKEKPVTAKIERKAVLISTRMDEVRGKLRAARQPLSFDELFPSSEKQQIVVTFLALLEMMKNQEILCHQRGNFDTIQISLAEETSV